MSPRSLTDAAAIYAIERPHPKLLRYYALGCLLAGPFFPLALLPAYFKYHTLRYRFDDEGISMRWGVLFRREIILNYARIQDIHLRSNLVERWLGLARLQIQTASGSADAEMTIEGLLEYEAIRDFVYSKMRGTRETQRASPPPLSGQTAAAGSPGGAELEALAAALRETARELRALRETLEGPHATSPKDADV